MITRPALWGLLFLLILVSRLCHVEILWPEENLPLAAAVQMLHGKALYGDVWFDKPPLTAAVYLLWGAQTGWVLRLAGALYVFACSVVAYLMARRMWGEREGLLAAWGLAFFLVFGLPSAVIPLAADLLMLLPHLAAVYLAWQRRPFWSGVLAGVALLVHSKGLFVLAACALWMPRSLPWLAAGFLAPNLLAAAWLTAQGSLGAYWRQFWEWGALYASHTFVERPLANGLLRTANWMGFHAALVAGAAWFWWRDRESARGRFALWAALSLAGVATGWRFFPRYYFQLLPAVALAAARGFALLGRRRALALSLLLLVPLVRFGPRYAELARDLVAGRPHPWSDVAMDRDSRDAARILRGMAAPGDTLFVWGFRPELYAYTRLPAGTRFLESQPLTGVFADRHLFQSEPLSPERTRAHREELARTSPTFVVDGLGPLNPALALESFPDLQPWLRNYRLAALTYGTAIYVRTTNVPPSTARASPGTPRCPPARPLPASSSS